jgi:hypothetical protein
MTAVYGNCKKSSSKVSLQILVHVRKVPVPRSGKALSYMFDGLSSSQQFHLLNRVQFLEQQPASVLLCSCAWF